MKQRNQKYWVIILFGLLSFLALFLYLIDILSAKEPITFWAFCKSLLISFPFMAGITWFDYKLVLFIERSHWLTRNLLMRVFIEAIAVFFLAAFFVIIGNIPFQKESSILMYLISMKYSEAVIASVLLNIYIVTIIEFFVQYKKNQKLKHENARMQYQQLKSQINPHFLFNSLNALISLINKDTVRATDYIKKLSDVYRYVLTHDIEDTVRIGDELQFIKNYIEILQIRFGSGIKFSLDVKVEHNNRRIPPMSLQVLIENVVKHNAITIKEPLIICIKSDRDNLIVSNNIIPRFNISESMGIGLENLKEKYFILVNKSISVEINENQFVVKLPLI